MFTKARHVWLSDCHLLQAYSMVFAHFHAASRFYNSRHRSVSKVTGYRLKDSHWLQGTNILTVWSHWLQARRYVDHIESLVTD